MDNKGINRITIVENICHGIVLIMFCLSTFFNYSFIAQLADTKIRKNNRFNKLIYIIEIVINIVNTLVILNNLYVNFRRRNLFRRTTMGNQSILFLIYIPAGIFVVTSQTIGVICTFNEKDTIYEEAISTMSGFVMFAILTWFLIHINTNWDYGEDWILNLSNMVTIEMTIANLFSRVIFSLGVEQTLTYLKYTDLSPSRMDMILDPESIGVQMMPLSSILQRFYYKLATLSLVIAIALLIVPLKRHCKFLQEYKIKYTKIESPEDNSPTRTVMSKPAIVISLIVVVLNIVFTIIYSGKPDEPLIIKILVIVTYIIAILNSYCLYLDLSKCSFKVSKSFLDSFFLWLGTFGQFIDAIAYILYGIYASEETTPFPGNFALILAYVVLTVQCFFQNIVIASVTERNIRQCKHSATMNAMYSPVYLFVINVMYFVRTLYVLNLHMPRLKQNFLSITLFENGFLLIGGVFAMFHRGYSAVVLLDYLK